MVVFTGCVPPVPGGIDSPDPNRRLLAIADAGASRDASKVPQLIEQLESNDAAARLLAIRSLEAITGQTHGYDYTDSDWERAEAVRRWRDWLEAAPQPGQWPEEATPGVAQGSPGP